MSTKLATVLADFTTQLITQLAIGGTTATLASATDDDGVALPTGVYFFTLDGDNSQKEHLVCTLTGTALTNIKSVSRQGVQTGGAARLHRIGASVSLTDFAHLLYINDLLKGNTQLDGTSPLGYDSTPSSLSGNQLATVSYVLGVVTGGTITFDRQVISGQVSGQALAINDHVYFKESDQRWYKVEADLSSTYDQLKRGFNLTTAGAGGVTIQIAISGPVSGFSALSAGSKYYASNTPGAISTTPGTATVFVGWALTTTQILFSPYEKTLPLQIEKDAMAGDTGTPGDTNRYLTQQSKSLTAVAGKIPQLDSNGWVPAAVLNIANLPIAAFEQVFTNTQNSDLRAQACNTDGSVMVIVFNTTIYRFVRDAITGKYFVTHSATCSGPVFAITIVGSFIYTFIDAGATFSSQRFALGDLSGATSMTIPSMPATFATPSAGAWTDGTYVYLVVNTGTPTHTVYQMSISGTTFSAVANTTPVVDIYNYNTNYWFDGTNIYGVQQVGTGVFMFSVRLIKLNDTTGSAAITVVKSPILNESAGLIAPIIGVPIDSKRAYVGSLLQYQQNNTPTVNYAIKMSPISLV